MGAKYWEASYCIRKQIKLSNYLDLILKLTPFYYILAGYLIYATVNNERDLMILSVLFTAKVIIINSMISELVETEYKSRYYKLKQLRFMTFLVIMCYIINIAYIAGIITYLFN